MAIIPGEKKLKKVHCSLRGLDTIIYFAIYDVCLQVNVGQLV